jgi:hypothetical protein
LRRQNFHRQRESPLLSGLQGADVDDLASNFLAAVVADGDDHEIFQRLLVRGMPDDPLYA